MTNTTLTTQCYGTCGTEETIKTKMTSLTTMMKTFTFENMEQIMECANDLCG